MGFPKTVFVILFYLYLTLTAPASQYMGLPKNWLKQINYHFAKYDNDNDNDDDNDNDNHNNNDNDDDNDDDNYNDNDNDDDNDNDNYNDSDNANDNGDDNDNYDFLWITGTRKSLEINIDHFVLRHQLKNQTEAVKRYLLYFNCARIFSICCNFCILFC